MKSVYVIQPYEVGSKRAKSLAMVIPATIARKYNLNASTIFTLRPDDKKEIRLLVMEVPKRAMSTDIDSAAFNEHEKELNR